MQTTQTFRNHTVYPDNNFELLELRAGKWNVYQESNTETAFFKGEKKRVRSGLTFTPYANPTRCNAHCRFCSEELQRRHQKFLTAQNTISDYARYFEALESVLADLSTIQNIGLSLSGLEATSDPQWLLAFLKALSGQHVPQFNEKVLYTNSSGLHSCPELIYGLRDAGFNRLEISRCHYNDTINQSIMFINRDEPVYRNEAYEKLIQAVLQHVHVKNSCILTKVGINSITEVERYLDWALSLGVKQVVFRELSRLDDTYLNNKTKIWVEQNRVPIDLLLGEVMPDFGKQRKNWQYAHSKAGYYYYNEHFRYKDEVEVIMETSSYNELMSRNESDVVQKLVFHSNGNLCGDWDPESHVIGNYFF